MTNNSNPSESNLDLHDLFVTHTQIDRLLRLKTGKALESTDLTMMEWLLLISVRKQEQEGLTVSEVAELLGVSLPQVTALTQQLFKKGLLKQQVERHDRRSRRLCVTPKGESLSKEATRDVAGIVSSVSDEPQLHGYRQLLTQLAEQKDAV